MMCVMPVIDVKETGKNILHLRQMRNLSVKDLQQVFGFETPQAIYKWQHGTALPTVDNLVILSIIFEVKMEDILVLSEKKEMKMCERYLRYVFS